VTQLAFVLFGAEIVNNFGMWLFLSVGAVALFVVFIPLLSWIDSRRKEREAFYKAETFRRLAEASGEGAKAATELLREQDRLKRVNTREGMKVGGMVNIGIGIGLTIFLRAMMLGGGPGSPYLCGLIPGFIGVALLSYALFLAPRAE
jgi:hypothetical protein